jgi:hypothetical protein
LALTNLKVIKFRKIGDISYVRNFVKNGQENIMGTAREQFFPSAAKMEQMY